MNEKCSHQNFILDQRPRDWGGQQVVKSQKRKKSDRSAFILPPTHLSLTQLPPPPNFVSFYLFPPARFPTSNYRSISSQVAMQKFLCCQPQSLGYVISLPITILSTKSQLFSLSLSFYLEGLFPSILTKFLCITC